MCLKYIFSEIDQTNSSQKLHPESKCLKLFDLLSENITTSTFKGPLKIHKDREKKQYIQQNI